MPVTTEREEKPAGRGRGWLWLPLGLLALALLVPVVLFVRPLRLTVGGHLLLTGVNPIPASALIRRRNRLFYSADTLLAPAGATFTLWRGPRYRVEGPVHTRGVLIIDRLYYVTWFKGRRLK